MLKKVSDSISRVMRSAIDYAREASVDELPIAAILLDDRGQLVQISHNEIQHLDDPTAHAEMLVLRRAGHKALASKDRVFYMFVTLEPCPMCAWAIRISGVRTLVYGAANPRYGSAGSVYDLLRDGRARRSVEVIGDVLASECSQILAETFLRLRDT